MMDADWSDLPSDLLVSIAQRIVILEDFAAFRAACKSWRSKATKENFTGDFTDQVPILMLPMNEDKVNPLYYSVRYDSFSTLHLRVAEGDQILSSLGWLLIVSRRAKKFTLLHPFNHTRIELPFFFFQLGCDGRWKSPASESREISKFILSSSPSKSSDYIVFLVYERRHLAFCKPGKDKYWRRFGSTVHYYVDLTCFNGEFYVVDSYGCVRSLYFLNGIQMQRVSTPNLADTPRSGLRKLYLVESAGALLVVYCYVLDKDINLELHSRSSRKRKYSSTVTNFRVFEVSSGNGFGYSEVKNLGNRSLFLSDRSASFSVEVSDTCGCKANCIYFTDDESQHLEDGAVMDMGIFHMENRKINRNLGESYCYGLGERKPSFFDGHLWILPSL